MAPLTPDDLKRAPAIGSSNGRIVLVARDGHEVRVRKTKLLEALVLAKRVARKRKVPLEIRIGVAPIERDVFKTKKVRGREKRVWVSHVCTELDVLLIRAGTLRIRFWSPPTA